MSETNAKYFRVRSLWSGLCVVGCRKVSLGDCDVFLEEEFPLFEHYRGECFLRDGPALVLLACKQGHVAFVVKPSIFVVQNIKNTSGTDGVQETVGRTRLEMEITWPQHIAATGLQRSKIEQATVQDKIEANRLLQQTGQEGKPSARPHL